MDDDGLPKGIRNRNDVEKPPNQSKIAIIAVAIAMISIIISTLAWIYQNH
jgi:hypothetical protein